MVARILSGREVAKSTFSVLKNTVEKFSKEYSAKPQLVIIQVGDRKDSTSYIKAKSKAAKEIGVQVKVINFEEKVTEEKVLDTIRKYNTAEDCHGLLVQVPLPPHISKCKVFDTIIPLKDVDGFNPTTVGKLVQGNHKENFGHVSCTAAGCLELLRNADIDPSGKHAVVMGRSNIVGRPVCNMLEKLDATVTSVNSFSQNVPDIVKLADILVVAIGVGEFVKGEWLKPGCVVLDVGINHVDKKQQESHKSKSKIVGDVDFDGAKKVASIITPVPGGVGPMTVAMLLQNTVKSAFLLEESKRCTNSKQKVEL